MKEIALYTHDGKLVAYVLVPSWENDPEVYQWGTRIFVRRAEDNGTYQEADGFFVILPRADLENRPYTDINGIEVTP